MDHIKIEGYKSFRNLDVKLNKINLLIGSNGAGKSNFLSVFELLNVTYNKQLAQYVGYLGSVDKLLYQGRKVTDKILVKVSQGKNSYEISLMEADGTLKIEREGLAYCPNTNLCDTIDISHFKDEAQLKDYHGATRADYIKKYMSDIKKFHFHDTGRKSPFTLDAHVLNDSNYLYSRGQNLAAIIYRIYREDIVTYKRIIKVIQSVAPYFLDFEFNPTEGNTIRLQWHDRYSEQTFGPTDFSDGTIRFIAFTVLFLQPWLPSVIIVDEPELGLHPFAIEKLAGLIKVAAQRGTQVIVATQSAELISNFDPEDVLTVNQRDGETTIGRLKSEELQTWLDSYTLGDLWKQNILKGGQPR